VIEMGFLKVIRTWALRDKMPIREIAWSTGISRNTIKKYLREGIVEPAFQTPDRGTFVPLVFAPGEAFQFDWSEDSAYVGGERIKLQVAHIKLSEPPRVYRRAKLSENCPLWNMHKRRRPRSRSHPSPDSALKMHKKVSSASVRFGWLWSTAMIIRAKRRR
jgi:hypothetical protein